MTPASSSGTVGPQVSDEGMTFDLRGELILSSLTIGMESPSSMFSSLPGFEMSISSVVAPCDFSSLTSRQIHEHPEEASY